MIELTNLHYNNYVVEYDKIRKTLNRLSKIGKIISIEIDLDPFTILSNDTLKLAKQHDGLYHMYSAIYIDYQLMDKLSLNHFLKVLVEDTESIINNIIIQMASSFKSKQISYNLTLDDEHDNPMILSVSDERNYFDFLRAFEFLWLSSK